MPLDLSKLRKSSLLGKETNPREIFNLLPNKQEKYKYPRDVQSQIWDAWLPRRNERDTLIKMNTGGGKTVVGLLILKSCINEQIAPAVYVAPDNYLVQQIISEARDLGIEVADSPKSANFLQGKAILVTNIHTLINGRSVFGVGDDGVRIPIGTVLIDDAHACLATAESQFTLSLDRKGDLYNDILKVFRDDLLAQNDAKLLEIEEGAPDQEMLVPFWSWQEKALRVAHIFTQSRDNNEIKFNWPLIKDNLRHCRCVVSGSRIEISPRCLPIEAIPSFVNAKRRLFLTATLADDSILVSDFNCRPEFVKRHITPKSANDIGDRMILIPQEVDPDLGEEEIKEYLKKKSKNVNIVVIVPSGYRAKYWEDAAKIVATSENLASAVDQLKSGHVGLVVLVNKYDGVDLPGDACRILVLDGLPQARRLYEKIETNILAGSEYIIAKQIQRIEQGMGRGIRANDDYCVVMLMGASLTSKMFMMGAREMFSPATRGQLEQSNEIAGQLSGLADLDDAVETCLTQSTEWKEIAREAVANISYPDEGRISPIAVTLRAAFDDASINATGDAEAKLQKLINDMAPSESATTIGWLKWQLAEYMHARDPIQAQQTLKSALQQNRRVTRPIDGIEYEKLDGSNLEQAKQFAWKIRSYTGNMNSIIIQVNGILDELSFAPDNANAFEQALYDLAAFLGFKAQRPENEYRRGPDVLWAVGNLRYFVIECKSSATAPLIAKHYANQLTGSVMWFGQRYDQTSNCVPVMIHPFREFEPAGTPHPDTRIMTSELIPRFKDAVRACIKAASASAETIDSAAAAKLLDYHKLTPDKILSSFTAPPKQQ